MSIENMHLVPFKIDIDLLKKGDKKAYEAIYIEFYDVLYHLSLQYLGVKQQAEEIVQEAFLKLWEHRDSLNQDTNIRNFLYTIVKNNSLNHIRNKQTAIKHYDAIKYQALQLQFQSLERIGDEVMLADELQARIDKALNRLSKDIKDVFILSRFEELKYREIADQLKISTKTVESRMSKALSVLREDLKDYILLYPFLLCFLGK